MLVRSTFPQVYALEHRKGDKYWLVSARSAKWGMNERKTFGAEKEALDYARQIEKSIRSIGMQSNIPKEKLACITSYEKLVERLAPHGKTPEDAVDHYVKFLGDEILRQAKPPIRELADKWRDFKLTDTTLSAKTVTEIRFYARWIKTQWGDLKPDEPKKNEIDVLLRGMKRVTNNTRRKYLRYIRMFFSWVKDEHLIDANPTDGIFYKPDDFTAGFYDVPTTKKLLRYVAENKKDLIGYYALLTFAGLRPSEGARVHWQDYTFKTNELYVRKGKTNARHIILEPAAAEWMKWFRENIPSESPFVKVKNLSNREREIRGKVLNGDWVQDGLRHGFGTYYKSKIKDIGKVADYMGNSADMVKRHYARTIPADECAEFWAMTPAAVLAEK
ncbi:MAG: site-specific integrase [Verrucomicrobia bacterium]|nr:site-specific integrase [Verrucomicrobiota bacterium]